MLDGGRCLLASLAEMTNLASPEVGAWGTTILRKQVGQEIFEPVSFASAVMCWPQMGQANLNSLMAHKFTQESRRSRAQSLVESPHLARKMTRNSLRATVNTRLEEHEVKAGDWRMGNSCDHHFSTI